MASFVYLCKQRVLQAALPFVLLAGGTGVFAQERAPLDPGLAATITQQVTGADSAGTGLLSQVPALNADVPAAVLQQAEQMLAPSKHYVQNLTAGEANPDTADMAKVTTVVFISLSMPQSTLATLFAQGSGRKDVAFVLRGWQAPDFSQMIGAVMKQMPKGRPQASVLVYPQAFEEYGIDQVPVTIHQSKKTHKWYKLTGEIALDGAIAELERGHGGRVVGNTYPIAEPDILEVIHTRMAATDWTKQMADARQHAAERPFSGVEMPRAARTESHTFDPSVVMARDIVNPANGQLLARAGQRVNPLELQSFPYVVLAFDPYDNRQLQWAADMVKAHPTAIVFVTRNAVHADGQPTWNVIHTRTYPLDERSAERFDIHSVPTMVQQQGKAMLVQTFAPSDTSGGAK